MEILEKLEKVAKGSERTRTWYIEKNGGHDFDDVIEELEGIVRGKVA